ncbi:MAG: F0F1 ATP synthase subunit delta [Candidatus Peribacteraceae bacterium]|jgi:F-type H+-transporting ATPase subunit delta
MKITAEDIARWLIETFTSLPQAQHAEAADAALDALRSHGLSREVRTFPHTVRRMLEKRGMVFAEIVTPAEDGGAGHIASAIEAAMKKKVSLTHKADPSLLGGALLSIGDERFDASVRGSLNRFQQSLSSTM